MIYQMVIPVNYVDVEPMKCVIYIYILYYVFVRVNLLVSAEPSTGGWSSFPLTYLNGGAAIVHQSR